MMDGYQPIYDAVRSRISGGDIGRAVESALREANLSHYADMASRAAQEAASEHMRPSVLFRPTLAADGNMWMALLGGNLQEGVAGFGETPAKAMYAFDDAFWREQTPRAIQLAKATTHAETGSVGTPEGVHQNPAQQEQANDRR